jgi:tripartite-type tricarboxylate transporter receptor subunit TctC
LSERLGQQFIVENRPGAGGNIGTEAVVRASPDGYTLLYVTTANASNATVYDKLNFNFVRDIAPIAPIVSFPYIMVVNLRFLPRHFPNSLPMPRPIPAKSIWRRPASAARPMSSASCSR